MSKPSSWWDEVVASTLIGEPITRRKICENLKQNTKPLGLLIKEEREVIEAIGRDRIQQFNGIDWTYLTGIGTRLNSWYAYRINSDFNLDDELNDASENDLPPAKSNCICIGPGAGEHLTDEEYMMCINDNDGTELINEKNERLYHVLQRVLNTLLEKVPMRCPLCKGVGSEGINSGFGYCMKCGATLEAVK